MAKFNSKFKYMYDAAPEIALVTKDHVAKTASFNGTVYALETLNGYWNVPAILADEAFAVVFHVEALDQTTGDEVYTVELEFGPIGFATSIKPFKAVVTKPGQYAFLVDIDTIVALKADVAAMRLAVTLAGTTPSVTLYAFIAGQIIDGV